MFVNNIIPFKERNIDYTKSVRIYRNLTKKGVWYSIVQHGITVAHASCVSLKDCTFNVSEKSRQWVITNKRKVLHAYIRGYITNDIASDLPMVIKYNPYNNKGFVCVGKSFLVKSAKAVICCENGVKADFLEKM
jgi:hypothetical protein